jgi:hypothetical protein
MTPPLLIVLLLAALAQDQPVPALPFPPRLPQPQPVAPIVCDGTENPCDASRPWMRGSVEKFCGTAAMLAKLKKEHPGKDVKACACRHKCDPADPHAEQTMNRRWDGRCEARCSTSNCKCPNACDT